MAVVESSADSTNISWKRNLYALWIAQLLTIVGFSLRAPFLPFFLDDLGANTFASQAIWSGVINAGGALVMAVSAPVWGIIADRFGRKPMVLRAMFFGAFTIGLMSLATNPWHLLILRFFEGAFTGTVAASTTLVASTTPKRSMGFALGMMQTAVFTGASIGPLFGGLLADYIGFRPTFIAAGSMLFIGGIIVLLLVHEDFTPPKRGKDGGASNGPGLRTLLFGGAMIGMVAVMFALRTSTSAIQPIMPLYVQQLTSATGSIATLSGLTLGVAGVTSAIAAVMLGRLADRIGHKVILISSTVAVGLLYLPMAIAQSPFQLIVMNGLLGVAAGGVMPSANAIVANLTPSQRRGAVYGFLAAATSVGGFVGPLGGAGLAAAVDIRYVFVVTGLLMLLAGLWVFHIIRSGADIEGVEED
ncbi:MAG: MFS transporter [Chloroflexia bacterium]|nr:MFS transporter [Chloroflexia bacterium]